MKRRTGHNLVLIAALLGGTPWAPGGFPDLGTQVPIDRRDRWSISTSAGVHLADFGNVEAFGRDIGRLDGPVTTFQLGMNYEWKDR